MAFAAALALALIGCKTEDKAAAPKVCCEQPKPEPGVAPLSVVADDVVGGSDEQKVKLRVGLSEPIKRDAVYPMLHALYRHAMKRGPFEPIDFVAEVYANDGDARAASEPRLLAKISRSQSEPAPRCDNRVRYNFDEQLANSFAASLGHAVEEDMNDTCHLAAAGKAKGKAAAGRVDEAFTHKPAFKPDDARQAVAVTFPYLEMGKDEYVKTLRFNQAMTEWIEFVVGFIRRVDAVKEVSYTGLLNDAPVLQITITRQQYESTFASLQEDIAAHAAITVQTLGNKKTSDKAVEKDQETFKTKTYKAALATLPKSQVTVSPLLK